MTDIPVYVNCRDRVRDLRDLVAWLERAGHQRIILLDNQSRYEPLLQYLSETPHTVVPLDCNYGSRSLWLSERIPDERFVYTDPDVVPTDECPAGAVSYLAELLDRYPQIPKAGLGLHLEDVPPDMSSLAWERSLVARSRELEPGVYDSLVDTTFALYRPKANFEFRAIRTGPPYTARHMSWYVRDPDAEDAYYLAHAMGGPLGSSWKESAGDSAASSEI